MFVSRCYFPRFFLRLWRSADFMWWQTWKWLTELTRLALTVR